MQPKVPAGSLDSADVLRSGGETQLETLVQSLREFINKSFILLSTYQGPWINGFVLSSAEPSAFICISMGL